MDPTGFPGMQSAEGDLSNRVAQMDVDGEGGGFPTMPRERKKARAKYIFIDELPLRRRMEIADYEGAGHETEIFIKGLAPHVNEDQLWRYIKGIGGRGVKEILIPRDCGNSKGCAYVEFVSANVARQVRRQLHMAPKRSIPGPEPLPDGSMFCWFSESERIGRGGRGVYQQNVLAKLFGHNSENIIGLKNDSGALRISMNGSGCANDQEKRLHLEVVFDAENPDILQSAADHFSALVERIHSDLPMKASPEQAPETQWRDFPKKDAATSKARLEEVDLPENADMPVVLYRKTKLPTGLSSSVECFRIGKSLNWSGGKQASPDMADWKPIPLRWGVEMEIFFLLFHRGDQRTRMVVASHKEPMDKWPILAEKPAGQWSPMCRFTAFVFEARTYIAAMEPDRATLKIFHMPGPNAEWENVREIDLDQPNDEGITRNSKLTVFYMGKIPHFLCVDRRGRPDSCTRVLKIENPEAAWQVMAAPTLPPSSRVLPLYMRTQNPFEQEVFMLAVDKTSGDLSLHFLARRDPTKPWEVLHRTKVAPDTRYSAMYCPGLHEPLLVAGSRKESSLKVMACKLNQMISRKVDNPYSVIHDHPMKRRSDSEVVLPLDLTMDLPSSTHTWVEASCPKLQASTGGDTAMADAPPAQEQPSLSWLTYRTVGRGEKPRKVPEFHQCAHDLVFDRYEDSDNWKVVPLRWGMKGETFVLLHHRRSGILKMSIVTPGAKMSDWPTLAQKDGMFSVSTRFTNFVHDDKTYVVALDPKAKELKVYHISAPNADWDVVRNVKLDEPNDENLKISSKLKAFYVGKDAHLVNVCKRSPPDTATNILKINDPSKPWQVLGAPRLPPRCRIIPLYMRNQRAFDHEVFLLALDKTSGQLHMFWLGRRDPNHPWEHVHTLPVPPDSRYAGVYTAGQPEPLLIAGSIVDGTVRLIKPNLMAIVKDEQRPINVVTVLKPYDAIADVKGKANKLGEFECYWPVDATMDLPASAHAWTTTTCQELGETIMPDERRRKHRRRSRSRGRKHRRREEPGAEASHGSKTSGGEAGEEAAGSERHQGSNDGGEEGDKDTRRGRRSRGEGGEEGERKRRRRGSEDGGRGGRGDRRGRDRERERRR